MYSVVHQPQVSCSLLPEPLASGCALALLPRDKVTFGEAQKKLASPQQFTRRVRKAIDFAIELHHGQSRKGMSWVPYMNHLLRVMTLVTDYGPRPDAFGVVEYRDGKPNILLEDVMIAAVLHDSVEDQGGLELLPTIEKKFGPVVAELVLACSDIADKDLSYNERKLRYLTRLAQGTRSALLIAACDKLDNLRSSERDFKERGEAFWNIFGVTREEKQQYHRDIIRIFAEAQLPPMLKRELADTYHRLQALQQKPSSVQVLTQKILGGLQWVHKRIVPHRPEVPSTPVQGEEVRVSV